MEAVEARREAASGESTVSLVIPGRNCSRTIGACLDAVAPLRRSGRLAEILFVDDGSTDATRAAVEPYERQGLVRVLTGAGLGPGHARNLGWRAASTPLVWCVDSDCVAEPDALERLTRLLDDPQVAAAGGSYGNLHPESLLATLIHEEIVARHRRMGREVDFLATFNVVYRRTVLEAVGGFDESLRLAQDAELAFRIVRAGYLLRFDVRSRVGHFHPTGWRRYLKTQLRHGFYRMRLYRRHPTKMQGDSYAGRADYAQPPLAMLAVAALPLLAVPGAAGFAFATAALSVGAILLLSTPLAVAMLRDSRDRRTAWFPAFSLLRAFYRGVGMTAGLCSPSTWFRPTGAGAGPGREPGDA